MKLKKYNQFINESANLEDFEHKINSYFQSLIDDSVEFEFDYVIRDAKTTGIYIIIYFERDVFIEDDMVLDLKHISENIKIDYKDIHIFYKIKNYNNLKALNIWILENPNLAKEFDTNLIEI